MALDQEGLINRKTPCAESLVHTYARKLNDIWPYGIDSVRASDGPQGCECGNGINDRLAASVKVAIVISSGAYESHALHDHRKFRLLTRRSRKGNARAMKDRRICKAP
jgi:hypothetical protein